MNRKLRAWIKASRVKFFIATLIPLILGGVIAAKAGYWDTQIWLVVLVASFLVHLNTNLANDYFDFFSGADSGDSIGGTRVIQSGLITPNQIRNVLILFYFISLLCGLWLLWKTKLMWLIAVMLFSFFSSLFYTAPPFKYGYRALGEVFVGINMGPIMVAGTASVLMGEISFEAIWISLPIGLMVAFILYYQSLSDIYDDSSVGKTTIAVLLGRNRFIRGYRIFGLASILSIMLLVGFNVLSPLAYLSVFTIFFLVKLDRYIVNVKEIHLLHDQGGPVRMFYLINGLILIFAVHIH